MLRKLTPVPGRRVDPRIPAELPVTMRLGKRRLVLTTGDVSHGGLFVATSEPLDLRQLVHVDLALPTDGLPFTATGWLVHARPIDGDARGAGVGVQFYGLGRDDQERWDAFVVAMRTRPPRSTDAPEPVLARGVAVHREFKRDAAQVAVIRVTFADLGALRTALARDVERGALFFTTGAVAIAVGDRVGLEVVHPIGGDVFEIEGRVRRVVNDATIQGLEVKLALDGERRARFDEFVRDPIAEGPPGGGEV